MLRWPLLAAAACDFREVSEDFVESASDGTCNNNNNDLTKASFAGLSYLDY